MSRNKSQIKDLQEALAALEDNSSKACHLSPAQRDALRYRISYLETVEGNHMDVAALAFRIMDESDAS